MPNNFLPKNYAEYLGLGAEIAASLIIPILTGYFLDEYFETSPKFILAGILLAFVVFGLMIARINKKLNKRDDDQIK
ncbi:MAG TPA: AtpZ/AtpI family protein [Gracilimonas sp.]|uniref:AtpZ/AtpI family protein n=1 Tax=Gracilimonas sp. TaxID=1974203 RepID=UPI002DAA6803|nr:AtpZ/AtpI family protein [Gracilimonas sp.]